MAWRGFGAVVIVEVCVGTGVVVVGIGDTEVVETAGIVVGVEEGVGVVAVVVAVVVVTSEVVKVFQLVVAEVQVAPNYSTVGIHRVVRACRGEWREKAASVVSVQFAEEMVDVGWTVVAMSAGEREVVAS